ncbi:MAG: hypothetical protein Q9209_002778 [Squamulea sp. 1 TL-2023]
MAVIAQPVRDFPEANPTVQHGGARLNLKHLIERPLPLFVENVVAAPAGSPPNARDLTPSLTISVPTTLTTSDINLATVTPAPAQKRQAIGDINILDELEGVLPQRISPSSSLGASSSTFEFIITRPTAPAAAAARVVQRNAQIAPNDEGASFGLLNDLSFPQKISSSSTSSSSTTAFELSPTRYPGAAPVAAAAANP